MTTTINASTSSGLVNTADTSGILQLQTASTAALTIDASQNVGIGTASPTSSSVLDVVSGGNTFPRVRSSIGSSAALFFQNSDTGTTTSDGMYVGITGAEEGVIWNNENTDLRIATNNTERMRIDSSGNVGIGTTSPSTYGNLAVYTAASNTEAAVVSGGANYATYRLQNSSIRYSMQIRTDQSNAWVLRDETGGANRLLIRASDGVLFSPPMYATTTGNSANVVVNPDGGVLRSTSALKYKQDIRDLPSIDITKFRPIVYKSKCEGDDQTKDHFGFIADEVDAAGIKELVQYGAKGEVEGFSYDRLSAVLVKAIQELKAINDTQAETINALTARIVALEGV